MDPRAVVPDDGACRAAQGGQDPGSGELRSAVSWFAWDGSHRRQFIGLQEWDVQCAKCLTALRGIAIDVLMMRRRDRGGALGFQDQVSCQSI